MKKIAPHIRNKQGSMLMLTLIVFMVILILGMTMITSMLYSQGENTMQINKQKAYYAAQSAVEAVKSYFISPESNTSTPPTTPHDLIGLTGTYNLKDQEIDEDTTVELSISRDKDEDRYILITAKGICQGEESIVTAKMLEEVQEGSSGGLYDSQVVFGSNGLMIKKETIVKGSVYLDTQDTDHSNTINYLNMKKTENHDSTLYIKNTNSDTIRLTDSNLADVYIETQQPMQISSIKSADNIYLRYVGNSSQGQSIHFQNNTIKGKAEIYAGDLKVGMYGDINVGNHLIVSVNNIGTLGGAYNIKTPEFYVSGGESYSVNGTISGKKYRDLNTEVLNDSTFIPKDLSSLDIQEQQISTVISGLSTMREVLKTKPSWDKEAIKCNYEEISAEGEGVLKKDPANKYFDEYYDRRTNTRWVFPGYSPWYTPSTYTIKKSSNNNGNAEASVYYISNSPQHKDDTIFFINDNGDNNGYYYLNVEADSNQKLEDFYVYAPYFNFKFNSNFEYFSGSIIAKSVNIEYAGPKEVEFKAPDEKIEITGAPSTSGDSNNAGSSSGTTYIYKFESYIDKEVS